MNYKAYLNSNKWKDIRANKLFHNPRCYICRARKNLHVHHLHYENLGNETTHDLKVLCKSCHKKVHFKKNGSKVKMSRTIKRLKQMKHWKKFQHDPKRIRLKREIHEAHRSLDAEFMAIVST